MHYENISRLIKRIDPDIDSNRCVVLQVSQTGGSEQPYRLFWCTSTEVYTKQGGCFRTNCMDCLDRTNVVQSAIARRALDQSLARLGIDLKTSSGAIERLDHAFNDSKLFLPAVINR